MTIRSKRLLTVLAVLIGVVVILGLVGFAYLRSSPWWPAITLFDEAYRVENFRNMERIFPMVRVHSPEDTFAFGQRDQPLEVTYVFDGETRTLERFLERTETTGFLVIQRDDIIFEDYYQGNSAKARHTSWSVAKSFVSALIGIAIDEGHIASVDDPVDQYVPELRDSGYAGVPLRHVLQMASGVAFDEDYDSFFSDINMLFIRAFAFGTPLSEYVATLESERPSGEYNAYISVDSQVLGMVLEAATGRSVPGYLEEKLWQPLGMASDALWSTDRSGETLAFCCLNATLRDYARFGRLYLHQGNWNGQQVVPASWVQASVTPDAPYTRPGENPYSEWTLGYQYQWWIPEGAEGTFVAIGVWGQFIYLDPARELIIVKNSVDPEFDAHEDETIAVFQAIAAYLQ